MNTYIQVEYPHWTAEATKTKLHCLNCGLESVWMLNVGGDDEDELHICTTCKHEFRTRPPQAFCKLSLDVDAAIAARAASRSSVKE